MCGIFGFVNASGSKFSKALLAFEEFAIVGVVRGADATGVAVLPERKDEMKVYKRAMWGPEFITTNGYTKGIKPLISTARVVIGHHRAATHGRHLGDDNAHPFVDRHITLVHNGCIHNAYNITPKDVVHDVDSEAAAWAIAEHGEKKGLEMLRGPFALAWYNTEDKTFNIARNEGREMHCVYLHDLQTMVYTSEWLMAHWILTRNGIPLGGKYRVVSPHVHLKFNIDNPLEYTRHPFVAPQVYQNTGNFWSHTGGSTGSTQQMTPTSSTQRTTNTTTGTSAPRGSLWKKEPTADELDSLHKKFTTMARQFKKGHSIPTSKGKIRTIYTRLAEKGFRLGQTVRVVINSFSGYKNQKTHGMMHGTTSLSSTVPGVPVVLPNVSDAQYHAAHNAHSVHIIVVNCKQPTKGGNYQIVGLLETVVGSRGVKDNVTEILREKPVKVESRQVPGPGGKLIDVGTFMAMTNLGCGHCTGFVNPNQADKVRWIGDTAICHECVEDPDVKADLFPDAAKETKIAVH